MKTTRHGLVVSCLIGAAAWVAIQAAADAGSMPAGRRRSSTPEMRITGFHLVETKDGATLWEIWGDMAEVFEKEGTARVSKVSHQVTMALYSDQGKLMSRSDRAILNLQTKDVRLEGNITATSEAGSSLEAASLDWSARDRRLSTKGRVTLTKGGLVSRGVGMEAETDLERARILRRVRSQVMPDRAEKRRTGSPVPRGGGR
jgi:LPS export ABC transporter protein LptC